MGTERFFVFNEAGTLKRLKGRIVRFLDSEDPDNDDKVAIRASISVPAAAEGLSVANNLSDVASAATSRTNLGVNGIDEDAESTGTKLVSPSLYFDGTNDYLEIADDASLSFTDGTDDLPFSISGWIKPSSTTTRPIISKYSATNEWRLIIDGNGDIQFLMSDGTNASFATSTEDLTAYVGAWVHVAVTYGGAGPNSATAFTAAASEILMYVNGKLVTDIDTSNASYTGMVDTTDPVRIGRSSASYFEGSIKEVKLYNRELTAAEVVDSMNGDLGFSDEWGGADGGIYTSDFSATADGWTALTGVGVTGNIDSIGGENDNLRLVPDTSTGLHRMYKAGLVIGRRNRLSFDYYIPSSNSNIDGFSASLGNAGPSVSEHSATLDAWTPYTNEGICDPNNGSIYFYATDGGNSSFTDAGGDDVVYVRNVRITQIGTLLDARAENFNEAGGELLDLSSNAFVATNNGATQVGGRMHFQASSLDLTGIPTSSAGLSTGEVWSNSGVLTMV